MARFVGSDGAFKILERYGFKRFVAKPQRNLVGGRATKNVNDLVCFVAALHAISAGDLPQVAQLTPPRLRSVGDDPWAGSSNMAMMVGTANQIGPTVAHPATADTCDSNGAGGARV